MKIGFLSHADMSIHFFRAPIMRELKDLGHEVFAIAPKGAYSDSLASEFHYVSYELDKASINPLKVLKNSENLAKTLKNLNLDMLQTSAHKSNVFGTFAAKKAGISIVINLVEGLGSYYIDDDFKTKIVRKTLDFLYKRAFKLSNAAIFVNDSDPDYMIKEGIITSEKVKRIKSVGVDSEFFDSSKFSSLNLSDKKVVLMMGRALWHKGIREFYEAAEILKDRKDAQFVFVGDTYEGNKTSASREFLKNENVLWLGWRDDVAALYKSSYIFALPSYKEGFPRTILEAMSMSRACVGSDCSGNIEAIEDGKNGLICKVGDVKDLAKKIEILLDDEELCKKMGENGRKMVLENYDQKIITKKYIEFYRNFIDV